MCSGLPIFIQLPEAGTRPTSPYSPQVLPILLHCFWIKKALILTAQCLQLWPSPFSLGNHFDKHYLSQSPWLSQLQDEARWTACHVWFSPLHWAYFQCSLSISCHSNNWDMIYIVLKKNDLVKDIFEQNSVILKFEQIHLNWFWGGKHLKIWRWIFFTFLNRFS